MGHDRNNERVGCYYAKDRHGRWIAQRVNVEPTLDPETVKAEGLVFVWNDHALAQHAGGEGKKSLSPESRQLLGAIVEANAETRSRINAEDDAGGEAKPDPSFPPGTRVVVTGRSPQDGHDFTGRVGVVAAKQDHPTAVWVLFAPDLSPVSVPGQWLSVATEPPERKAEYRTRCGRFTVIGPEGDGYSNPTRDARDALDDALKPDPVKGADPNVERVRERLRERAAAGLTRYGTDTTREDFGRADWLRELQDELLDAAVYVEALRAAEEKA